MKWMSTPSISVTNCGSSLSRSARLREVVLVQPVARELLHGRELHALRSISNELPRGPTRRRNALAQVIDLLLGKLGVERADRGCGLDSRAHDDLPNVVRPRDSTLRLQFRQSK